MKQSLAPVSPFGVRIHTDTLPAGNVFAHERDGLTRYKQLETAEPLDHVESRGSAGTYWAQNRHERRSEDLIKTPSDQVFSSVGLTGFEPATP